ncbi:MAG: DUF4160 domain-containing protein [Planctomycetota bacterium]
MPEISRFFGIVIEMYHRDHAPPHFHAVYGSYSASFEIATGVIVSGSFPPRAYRLVGEWLSLHRAELLENWRLARGLKPLHRIDPLE